MKTILTLGIFGLVAVAWAVPPQGTLPTGVASQGQRGEPPLACGDYLKQMGRERPDIHFVGCRSINGDDLETPGFVATYHVQGKDIGTIDAWLATWANWKHLRFECCQWDSPKGFYRDQHGSSYELNLFADAYLHGHMVDQRTNLAQLPYATLTVTHYLYLP